MKNKTPYFLVRFETVRCQVSFLLTPHFNMNYRRFKQENNILKNEAKNIQVNFKFRNEGLTFPEKLTLFRDRKKYKMIKIAYLALKTPKSFSEGHKKRLF